MSVVDFGRAQWIWTADNRTPDQKVIFRKICSVDTVPAQADMFISCDTKFWLWINGRPVVYEGGLFRESRPGCGYAERVNIAPFLKEGDNVIALLVWYYGNGGRNNTDSGEAGLILSCPALSLYSDADFVDDRANAVTVLCGVCPPERYPLIRQVLLSVFQATPYMERFVLKALCEMGYVSDAYNRMMSRYYPLIVNDNSTLWEDFFVLGTRNHAWSGSPLEIAFRYFLGLKKDDTQKTYTIAPCPGIFGEIRCRFPLGDESVSLSLREVNGQMTEI